MEVSLGGARRRVPAKAAETANSKCAAPSPPTPGPSSSQISLQNMSVFSSLSLFLSIVRVNWEFYRISAWQFLPVVLGFGFMTLFSFFGKIARKNKQSQHRHISKAAGPVTQAFILSLYHSKSIGCLNE